jgi:t-SNARE complex subunit (syntaxin)
MESDNYQKCYELLDNITDRSSQIQQIQEDTIHVFDMMKDLSLMIDEQQVTITSIEDSVMHSKEVIKGAEMELEKAEIYHAKSGRKYILFSTILMVGVGTPVSVMVGIKAGLIAMTGIGAGSVMWKL